MAADPPRCNLEQARMTIDTDIGGARRSFPLTRLSVVEAAASGDEESRRRAFGLLVEVYWKPVYFHLRWRWSMDGESAKDAAQEFFAQAMTRDFFSGYDPARARFRTFLKSCLDHFAANERRAARRLKRGGGTAPLPLDFEGADREFARAGQVAEADGDTRFHQEWVRALFQAAVEALRSEASMHGHDLRFRLFDRHDLQPADDTDRPSYRVLAREFELPMTQVTNHLAWARREFRRLLLERLRELSGSEAEFREEARDLLGITVE
jgi:DNA-directed RNA polymerase specialized sigma24 family protein